MNSDSPFDRTLLRFSELAKKHFSFLRTHGFSCVQSESTFLRFESQIHFINVYHGRKSFEIGAEIGRVGNDEDEKQPYPVSSLLGIAGISDAKQYLDYAARTPEGVDEGLTKLSELLREHIDHKILQIPDLFVQLKEQRKNWARDFELEVTLQQARRKVDIAWTTKDYVAIVGLLEPLRAYLTRAELRKLEYAENKIADKNL